MTTMTNEKIVAVAKKAGATYYNQLKADEPEIGEMLSCHDIPGGCYDAMTDELGNMTQDQEWLMECSYKGSFNDARTEDLDDSEERAQELIDKLNALDDDGYDAVSKMHQYENDLRDMGFEWVTTSDYKYALA